MREITVYRMRQFFEDEIKRLELFEDLAAGINLEAALLMRRLPTNAAKLVLETRYPEELEAALAECHLPPPCTEDELVNLILDPSWICRSQPLTNLRLEAITRDLCFSLHSKRSTYLGYPSRYAIKCKHNLLHGRQ